MDIENMISVINAAYKASNLLNCKQCKKLIDANKSVTSYGITLCFECIKKDLEQIGE